MSRQIVTLVNTHRISYIARCMAHIYAVMVHVIQWLSMREQCRLAQIAAHTNVPTSDCSFCMREFVKDFGISFASRMLLNPVRELRFNGSDLRSS
jgi:hypothetical protein